MCAFHILHSNDIGQITNCSNCNHFKVCFGNCLLFLNTTQFRAFNKHINNLYDRHYADMLLTDEKLFIHTKSDNLMIALSTDELKNLCELLNKSFIMLQLNTIINPKTEQ